MLVKTDLGTTRESAHRLRFEPIGSISATNVQDAIEEQSAPVPTVMGGTGFVPLGTVALQVFAAAPAVLTVPESGAWEAANGGYGAPLSIFDAAGNASVNNITIQFTGGQTASGLANLVIATDYGGFRLQPKNGGGWVVV